MNTNGIGLGLHICKLLANYFGGDIACKSVWGKGAAFVFYFLLE